MIRGDLSNRLIHLTKGETRQDAVDRFIKIMKSGRLNGGNGFIRGGYNCVCFSEAPISVLSQMLARPMSNGVRYAPFGVMVNKSWLFTKGGRPVIYQAHDEYELLPDMLKCRHVKFEPNYGVDYSWEREWRIKVDELKLDPKATTFIVPKRECADKIRNEHFEEQQMTAELIDGSFMEEFPWHFLALEDLGVEVDREEYL